VCVSKLMYLIVYVLLCDAATQQLGGLCLRWAAERQDKQMNLFNFVRNFTFNFTDNLKQQFIP